jgi:hypothetical protein
VDNFYTRAFEDTGSAEAVCFLAGALITFVEESFSKQEKVW